MAPADFLLRAPPYLRRLLCARIDTTDCAIQCREQQRVAPLIQRIDGGKRRLFGVDIDLDALPGVEIQSSDRGIVGGCVQRFRRRGWDEEISDCPSVWFELCDIRLIAFIRDIEDSEVADFVGREDERLVWTRVELEVVDSLLSDFKFYSTRLAMFPIIRH